MAEGGGLLNRYTAQKLYRGFESPTLRHPPPEGARRLRSRSAGIAGLALVEWQSAPSVPCKWAQILAEPSPFVTFVTIHARPGAVS